MEEKTETERVIELLKTCIETSKETSIVLSKRNSGQGKNKKRKRTREESVLTQKRQKPLVTDQPLLLPHQTVPTKEAWDIVSKIYNSVTHRATSLNNDNHSTSHSSSHSTSHFNSDSNSNNDSNSNINSNSNSDKEEQQQLVDMVQSAEKKLFDTAWQVKSRGLVSIKPSPFCLKQSWEKYRHPETSDTIALLQMVQVLESDRCSQCCDPFLNGGIYQRRLRFPAKYEYIGSSYLDMDKLYFLKWVNILDTSGNCHVEFRQVLVSVRNVKSEKFLGHMQLHDPIETLFKEMYHVGLHGQLIAAICSYMFEEDYFLRLVNKIALLY